MDPGRGIRKVKNRILTAVRNRYTTALRYCFINAQEKKDMGRTAFIASSTPRDIRVLNELALFAGHGGGILAGMRLGWRCVCAVELDEYARSVLIARQNDGILPPFPIWDDIRTFDGRP